MKYFITICLSMISWFASAQQIKISEDIRFQLNYQGDILGKSSTGDYVVTTYHNGSGKLYLFNNNLKVSLEKELELGRRTTVIGTAFNKDMTHVFCVAKIEKRYRIIVKKFDLSGKLSATKELFEYPKFHVEPTIKLKVSENDKFVLLYDKTKAKSTKTFTYGLAKDSLYFQHALNLNANDYNFSSHLEASIISNSGDVFLFFNKNNYNSRKSNNGFLCYKLNEQLSTFAIPIPNLIYGDVAFEIDPIHNKIVTVGTYSKRSRIQSKGFFMLQTDIETLETNDFKASLFPQELVNKMIEKENNKKNKGLYYLKIVDMVLRHDGGCVLILEEEREEAKITNSPNQGMYGEQISDINSRTYINEKLLLLSFNENALLDWSLPLLKKQYALNNEFLYTSVGLMKTPLSLKFLFNDEIDTECSISAYDVESDGSYDHSNIMNTKDKDVRLMFTNSLQVSAKEIIVPSYERKELKLVRFIFD